MIVSTITQIGYDLSCDITDIPAQFSGDIEFRFIKDGKYENYVVVPHYKYLNNRFLENNRDSKTYQLMINNDIFKLPPQAFELDGYLAIAFSLSNGSETIQTNPIIYKVKATAGKGNILPEENTWQDLVIKVADDYIDLNVKDVVSELLSTSNHHQNEVNKLIERAITQQNEITSAVADSISATSNTRNATILATQGAKNAQDASNDAKVATTNANQATQRANDAANSVVIIRNGTTTPASSLGKNGDFYVNTANGDFYLKSNTAWNKKFNMIALDQITELKNAFNSVTVGVDSSDNDFSYVEKTGGSKSVELRALIGAIGGDTNKIGYQASNPVPGHGEYNLNLHATTTSSFAVNHSTVVLEANGGTPSKVQPYITCYMWKRTA